MWETLNFFFSDVIKNLAILQYEDPTVDTSDISNPVLKAIAHYKNHPSVRLIKNTFKNLITFNFHYVDELDIEKEIKKKSKS